MSRPKALLFDVNGKLQRLTGMPRLVLIAPADAPPQGEQGLWPPPIARRRSCGPSACCGSRRDATMRFAAGTMKRQRTAPTHPCRHSVSGGCGGHGAARAGPPRQRRRRECCRVGLTQPAEQHRASAPPLLKFRSGSAECCGTALQRSWPAPS